jgi:hypothetical protein
MVDEDQFRQPGNPTFCQSADGKMIALRKTIRSCPGEWCNNSTVAA